MVNVDLNHITVSDITTREKLTTEYPKVFQGIGKLTNYEVKLHIDTSVQPVAQPARRIPFHLRKKVSVELKKLEMQGINEKVEGPTPWISPLVVIPKRNCEVRLCIDMRMANRAIQRELQMWMTWLMHSMGQLYSPNLICVQAIISWS